MSSRLRGAAVVVAAALVASATPAVAATTGFTVLTPLSPGRDAEAVVVNGSGVALGWSVRGDGNRVVVRWAGGSVREFPPVPVSRTFPVGVDASGAGLLNVRGTWVNAVRWEADGRVVRLPQIAGGGQSTVDAVNGAGLAVGNTTDGSGVTHAATWDTSGALRVLPGLGTRDSRATSVDGAGNVSGAALGPDGRYHAMRWDSAGVATDLGVTSQDYLRTAGIDGEHVVASYRDAEFALRAFRWGAGGSVVELRGGPGWTAAVVADVDAAGRSVGSWAEDQGEASRPVAWAADGTPQELPLPSGQVNGSVVGLDGIGGAFGQAGAGTAGFAVRWDTSGGVTPLPVPPGSTGSVASGASGNGIVVGHVVGAAGKQAVRWNP
ncbi:MULTISPECIES: hypothetical protein [Actinosynnema]|uniref:hypothetical protein n=1 Tax=Actinosynnema TaxID=40566 RepID=UPI0020A37EAC|nr:hypothetical protein [Actinosynnema pretiosum]MCP2099396.1 hypothetical protein [Actinosynnema pretiosum]